MKSKHGEAVAAVSMIAFVLLLVGFAFAGRAPGFPAVLQLEPVDRLAWLSGCWSQSGTDGRITEEQWMRPRGGVILGMSRTVRDGRVTEYETLRIYQRGDTLVYAATPSGQAPAEFRATSASESAVVFENPAHDFPQRIAYRRVGRDSVHARVEGPGADGGMRGFDLRFARVRCEAE